MGIIKRLFGRTRREEELELAMEVDGHKLYQFKSATAMPFFRENIVRIGYGKMELGIRNADLTVMFDTILEYVNEGRLDKIATIVHHAQFHTENFGSTRIALEIGGYAVIVDDEPMDGLREKDIETKRRLAEKYPAVRDFFLSESVRALTNLRLIIDGQLSVKSLKNPYRVERERQFLRLIGRDIFNELWTPLTPPPTGWQKIVGALSRKI